MTPLEEHFALCADPPQETPAAQPAWYRRRDLLGMMLSARDLDGTSPAALRNAGISCLHLLRSADCDLAQIARACHGSGIMVGMDLMLEDCRRTQPPDPSDDPCAHAVLRDAITEALALCGQGVDIIWLHGPVDPEPSRSRAFIRLLRLACGEAYPGALLAAPLEGGAEPCTESPLLYSAALTDTLWHTVATADARLLRREVERILALPQSFTLLNALRRPEGITWALDYNCLATMYMEEKAHRRFLCDYYGGSFDGIPRASLHADASVPGGVRVLGTALTLCGAEAAAQMKDVLLMDRAARLNVMLHAFLLLQSGMPMLCAGDGYALPCSETHPRIAQLLSLRRRYGVFSADAEAWSIEPWNDHVLAIGRYHRGERLVALFNFSAQEQTAWINEHEDYMDLLTGVPCRAKAVTLEGYGFRWLLSVFHASDN